MTAHKVQGLADDALGKIILDGKKFDARLEGSITGTPSLERAIDAESTLTFTVNDPERFLLQGGYFTRRADLEFDDLWFRLTSMDKNGDDYALGFGDREVEILKGYTHAGRMSRADSTLAEFLRSRVRKAGPHIGFVCPDLHKLQPIAGLHKPDAKQLRDAQRRPEIAADAKLTVKGNRATRGQIKLMNRVLNVAEAVGAGERATLAMICANIGEAEYSSTIVNPSSGATGLFQLLPSTGRSLHVGAGDIEKLANIFLTKGFASHGGAIDLARNNPLMSPGTIASKVEGSDANGAFYDKHLAEAKKVLAAWGGATDQTASTGNEDVYIKQTVYSQGPPIGPKGEDVWACGRRYADLVHRRFFIVAGVVFYISDWELVRSRPRMTISDDTPGVDSVNFALSAREVKPSTVTIQCRATRWAAPPGTVIVLDEAYGDAAGAWIVSNISRPDLTDQATTITAVKPRPQVPEPAPQVATRAPAANQTLDGGINAGDLSAALHGVPANSSTGKAYRRAVAIDRKRYPYVWGGGHQTLGKPNAQAIDIHRGGGPTGYDCSGSVSAVLAAGGLLGSNRPFSTIDFLGWGQAGKGKHITVWVNAEHMFMEFDLPGRHVFFEFHHTGTIGGFEPDRDTTGFEPRHWPGT